MSREGEKALEGEWYDPAQLVRAEWLRLGFLHRIEDEEPKVLEGLHDEVLPAYQNLVEQDQSKDVERLLYARGHTIAAAAGAPGSLQAWEPPSAILESITGASSPATGLDRFLAAFKRWHEKWHLVDAWAHDEALGCLSDWVINPPSESQPDSDDDCSWWSELEAEQEENIAAIKEQIAEMAKLKPEGHRGRRTSRRGLIVRAIKEKYEKELRDVEKELERGRKSMEEKKQFMERNRSAAHRWPLVGSQPHVPMPRSRLWRVTREVYESRAFQSYLRSSARSKALDEDVRSPLPPPSLDAWDETLERRNRYLKRMRGVLEEYTQQVDQRARAQGLEPWPATRTGAGDSLVWVVRHQVMEQVFAEIAREQRVENKRNWESRKEDEEEKKALASFPPDHDTVRKSVNKLATDMGLTLRPTQGRATRHLRA